MKTFAIALLLIVGAILAGLLLALAGKVLFTGTSFPPHQLQDRLIYIVRVPASSPISP